MYKRRPVGDYHVGVCTNTLCAVMGGDVIFERLKEHLGVGNDETTDDGKVTLEHIECNAACDYAPVVTVNWEFFDNQTPESADAAGRRPARRATRSRSTRGPRICTWREAERVLAGFPDDRADEGPAAGPASLVGLELARERGWTAPDGQAAARPTQAADGRRRDRAGTAERPTPGATESETDASRGRPPADGRTRTTANGGDDE